MRELSTRGVTIAYGDAGSGEPAVLCLPGWCASRAAFDELSALLAKRARVLTPDWRGHGRSSASPGEFGLQELVDDTCALIEASGARQIVPLATAHAGFVALTLRRKLGAERVPKLVLVDWILGAAPPPFLAGLAAMQDPAAWRGARDHLFAMWREGVDDERVRRFVRDDMGAYDFPMWARAGREITAGFTREGSPLEALAKLATPTLFLFAQGETPPAHPWLTSRKLDGRSHFPTIETPEAVAAHVSAFLSEGR